MSGDRKENGFHALRSRLFVDTDDEDVPVSVYGTKSPVPESEISSLGKAPKQSFTHWLAAAQDEELLVKLTKKPKIPDPEWDIVDSDEEILVKKSVNKRDTTGCPAGGKESKPSGVGVGIAAGGFGRFVTGFSTGSAADKPSGFGGGMPAGGRRRRTALTSIFSPTKKTSKGVFTGSLEAFPATSGPLAAGAAAVPEDMYGAGKSFDDDNEDEPMLSPDGHGSDFGLVSASLKTLSQAGGRVGKTVASTEINNEKKRKSWSDEEKLLVTNYVQQCVATGKTIDYKELGHLTGRSDEAARATVKRAGLQEQATAHNKKIRAGRGVTGADGSIKRLLLTNRGHLARASREGIDLGSYSSIKNVAAAFQCVCGGKLCIYNTNESLRQWNADKYKDDHWLGCANYRSATTCRRTYSISTDLKGAIDIALMDLARGDE